MPRSADYRVKIVDENALADVSVFVVNGEVVDLTGAADGDVITVQPDGSLAAEPPAGGGTNLFIQDAAPVTAETVYQWWETGAGELVTLWVNV